MDPSKIDLAAAARAAVARLKERDGGTGDSSAYTAAAARLAALQEAAPSQRPAALIARLDLSTLCCRRRRIPRRCTPPAPLLLRRRPEWVCRTPRLTQPSRPRFSFSSTVRYSRCRTSTFRRRARATCRRTCTSFACTGTSGGWEGESKTLEAEGEGGSCSSRRQESSERKDGGCVSSEIQV